MTARTLIFAASGEPLVTTQDPAHALLAEVWGLLFVALNVDSTGEDLPMKTMDPQSAVRAIESVVGGEMLKRRWHAEIQRARAEAEATE